MSEAGVGSEDSKIIRLVENSPKVEYPEIYDQDKEKHLPNKFEAFFGERPVARKLLYIGACAVAAASVVVGGINYFYSRSPEVTDALSEDLGIKIDETSSELNEKAEELLVQFFQDTEVKIDSIEEDFVDFRNDWDTLKELLALNGIDIEAYQEQSGETDTQEESAENTAESEVTAIDEDALGGLIIPVPDHLG